LALGPKLARSARDIAIVSKDITVRELFPGLHDIECIKKAPENFSAIVFGRLNKKTDCVKQARLAVAGFSDACSSEKHDIPLGPESSLMVIGLPDGDEGETEREELKDVSFKEAGRQVQIHPWSYFEDRDKLFDELRRKSVCLVTSLYEGFGLVGWEAISAKVPLIVSKNSGLYEFIDEHFPGGKGCLRSIDIKGSIREDYLKSDVTKVSKEILTVSNNIQKAKREAYALKTMMQPACTWENCALSLANSLKITNNKTQQKELCSKKKGREICRLCHFSEVQLYEMFDNIKKFYGF